MSLLQSSHYDSDRHSKKRQRQQLYRHNAVKQYSTLRFHSVHWWMVLSCFVLLATLHVANAQDPLYQPQQGGRRRSGGRSIFHITSISQRRPDANNRNVYQPDWSSRFLTEAEWKSDPRARLYQVNQVTSRHRSNQVSWTNRLLWFNILAFAAQVFFPPITNWGVKLSDKILRGQQLYRLVTPMFLHGGIAHLFTNMYSLQNVGPDLERLVGSPRLVLTYLISGVAGNMLSAWCSPNPSLGASGAVFGMVAAYYVFFLRNEWMLGRWGLQMQQAITQTIALNLIMGALNPMVDQWGHVGGAIGGAMVAYAMGPRLYLSQNQQYNCIVDRPPIRIPSWIETLPQRLVVQPWTRLTRQLQQLPVVAALSRPSNNVDNNKPWRQPQNQQQRQQHRQNVPNRSIKPRW